MDISQLKIKEFQNDILAWYKTNKRDLPWRKTREPYYILVSEVMLQQTQVGRVIPKYEAWFQTFPTIQDLANASVADVLRAWSGLGYNRRALFLQKTAQAVVEHSNGDWPQTIEELEKLPGIGKYTSRALACFAFDEQVAVIDTNIRKVIAVHFFNGVLPKETILEEVANQLLLKGHAYDWNQALMDYAAAELTKYKIPVNKQSKFVGSKRYYRGNTLKRLFIKNNQSIDELVAFFAETHPIDKLAYEAILSGLIKEGMVKREKDRISLV